MKASKAAGSVFFALVVMLLACIQVAQADSRIETDIQVVQSEIRKAQGAFTQVRKSRGKDTAQFDAAVKRLRARVNALNKSLGSAKLDPGAKPGDLDGTARRLNAYLRSLEKARDESDWRSVERDLGRLDASAKELHSAALRVPGVPGRVTRTPPKPPATGPSGSPSVTPAPKPDSKPRRVGSYKPPLPVTRGPGPKGPDDPRFARRPHPGEVVPPVAPPDPPPPPKPGDSRSGRAKPMPMEEPAGQGSPPMMRKPARPPVKAQDGIPKPKPKGGRQATYSAQTAKLAGSQKIQSFLNEFDAANSMAEVRKAYLRQRFTESEAKSLEQQVLAGRYKYKLEKLVDDEKRNSRVVTKRKQSAILSETRNVLKKRQQQELKQLNTHASGLLDQLKSENATLSRSPTTAGGFREFSTGSLDTGTRVIDMDERHENLPPVEEIGEILSISGTVPQQGDGYFEDWGVPGGYIIITGNYFGDIEGEINFLPQSLRDQRRAIPVSVTSWSEHRIVGEIPEQEVRALLGDGHHVGRMIVKRHGADSGAGREFNLVSRSPRPQITGISTAAGNLDEGSITPGQTIIIMGQYFAPNSFPEYARSPDVELEHTGPTGARISTALQVNEFDDTWISAELGTIEGIPESRGWLKVRRVRDGQESPMVGINFRPTLNTWVLSADEEHRCWGFFGFKDTVTLHDHSLQNGWTVVDHEVRNNGFGGHGCNWLERPGEGSTETAARLEYWCDLFSYVSCASNVTIEGPAGIHWQ